MSPVFETARDGVILTGMDASTHPGTRISPGTPSTDPGAPDPSGTWVEAPKTVTTCEAPTCRLSFADAADPILPEAQRRWAALPVTERLQPFRRARHWIAAHPEAFARAVSPDLARSQADTLATEVLPLLDALLFLQRNAQKLLAPRRLGSRGRPLWLFGVHAELHHDPLGHVLVIAPANYPLFLAGVQASQALVAGNAVTWKPGTGGHGVAVLFAHILREAGLPRGILRVTEDSVEAAQTALAEGADKVIFTGSYTTGRHILRELAETATPATLELSGADAVVVLPSADLNLVAKAIAFGLRLNGAEVCMSPRRLFATGDTLRALRPLLLTEMGKLPPVNLKRRTFETLSALIREALEQGADLLTEPGTFAGLGAEDRSEARPCRPLLVDRATPAMSITRTDLFAPVLSLIEASSVLHLPDLVNDNPYGLTAAVFGDFREARTLAQELRVGTVVVNDLIAPTVDPRVPFGGRCRSGYGVTRGAEGLLEMTATKTVLIRRKGLTVHYDSLGPKELPVFAGLIGTLHGGTLRERWKSFRALITAARASRTRK